MDTSALTIVESKRRELETTIISLRASLRHWQTLELDYEGLREEFHLLPADATQERCLEVAHDFKPEALNDKDLQSLMKDVKYSSNRPKQLAHIMEKRIDYVTRNVETIRKQLEGAQKKLNVLLLAEDPDHQEEAGLPLGEITEELDEDGKVVSGKVDHAGGKAAGLADVLEKAGVKGLKEMGGTVIAKEQPAGPRSMAMAEAASTTSQRTEDSPRVEESPKPVIKPMNAANEAPTQAEPADPNDSDSDSTTSIPTNALDTTEEARLRQEMINYNLDSMSAIVAELDLAEGGSDLSYDDDDNENNLIPDSDFDDDFDDEDDSEDETGKTKHLKLSDGYKKKMEDLQKKLGLTDLTNAGPNPSLPSDAQEQVNRPSAAEAARKAALKRADETEKAQSKEDPTQKEEQLPKKPSKKKVAFSEALDIAEPPPRAPPAQPTPRTKPEIHTVNETVLERPSTPSTTPLPPAPAPPTTKPTAKLSRFKASRTSKPTPPTPPTDRLIAPIILERPSPSTASAPDPASIDDELHKKQLALDYHKLRSRKIHQQGGYVRHDLDGEESDEDDDDWYTKDPETGTVKKVSKFKAARLR